MLRHAVVLLAVVSVALAAVARQKLEEKPEEYKDCNGCWVSAIQQLIPLGESYPSPTQCMEYHCTVEYLELVSCGVVRAEPPCYTTEDKSLPYPKCCPQGVCPTD